MSGRAWLWLLATSAVVLVACGASNASGGASAITPFTPCLASALNVGDAGDCNSCVQTSCQPQGHAFDDRCAPYVSCICTDGQSPSAATVEQCAPMLSATACKEAVAALQTCSNQNCANQCGAPAPDAASQEDAGAPADAGTDAEGGAVTFSCSNGTGTTMECDQQPISPTSAQVAQNGCTQVGGTPGSGCPVTGVSGCCLLPTTENCYYDPAAAAQRQATCKSAGGSWSMMP